MAVSQSLMASGKDMSLANEAALLEYPLTSDGSLLIISVAQWPGQISSVCTKRWPRPCSAVLAGSASFISTSAAAGSADPVGSGAGGAPLMSTPRIAAKTVISLWSVNMSVLNEAGLVRSFFTFSTRAGSFINSAVFGLALSLSIKLGSEKILAIPIVGSPSAILASVIASSPLLAIALEGSSSRAFS
ncbi:hypothetical protein OGAPHI_003326 [Ogataea philodendri]|uniref:Uncharacterized protein n=1 Tax=Ogataea philodendri TaxID=1378263 RepID=A0A9P8P7T4_9ASCO|nr:uncharacterized protein OGAPHI_003326 [Ogataea philodendri]KAH3666877.1 hypothetical protein OGAPHI_003326 [Ogataea philodendri]